jgi:hypothetical protein
MGEGGKAGVKKQATSARGTAVQRSRKGPGKGGLQVVRALDKGTNQIVTEEQKQHFFAQLAATCNVAGSLAAAGISSTTLYRLRQVDPAFRADWMRALSEGHAMLMIDALGRARFGDKRVETTEDVEGKRVKTTVYSDARLTMNLLNVHARAVGEHRAAQGEAKDPAEVIARIRRVLEQIKAARNGEESGGESM